MACTRNTVTRWYIYSNGELAEIVHRDIRGAFATDWDAMGEYDGVYGS